MFCACQSLDTLGFAQWIQSGIHDSRDGGYHDLSIIDLTLSVLACLCQVGC